MTTDPTSGRPVVAVTALDHIVVVTSDVERQLAWWSGLLGLAGVRVDEWRRGEVPFPSVRISPDTIVDLQRGERTGVNIGHVCVVVQPGGLAAARASGRFDVAEDPDAPRFGARGDARSLYVRDPDGNVVELREY